MRVQDNEHFATQLVAIARKTKIPITIDQATRIARRTRDRIKLFEKQTPRIRPAGLSHRLTQIAKHLEKARSHIDSVGIPYLVHVYAAAGHAPDVDNDDVSDHLAYLSDLTDWTLRAASTASTLPETKNDQKGGRQGNDRLRRAVAYLAMIYQSETGIVPTHVISPNTGVRASCFDQYVIAAFEHFLPRDQIPGLRAIDTAVSRAVKALNKAPPSGAARRQPSAFS